MRWGFGGVKILWLIWHIAVFDFPPLWDHWNISKYRQRQESMFISSLEVIYVTIFYCKWTGKKNTKCLDVGIWCYISMYTYVFFFSYSFIFCAHFFFFFEAYPYTARLFLVVAAPVTFFWPSTLSSSIQTPKGLFSYQRRQLIELKWWLLYYVIKNLELKWTFSLINNS